MSGNQRLTPNTTSIFSTAKIFSLSKSSIVMMAFAFFVLVADSSESSLCQAQEAEQAERAERGQRPRGRGNREAGEGRPGGRGEGRRGGGRGRGGRGAEEAAVPAGQAAQETQADAKSTDAKSTDEKKAAQKKPAKKKKVTPTLTQGVADMVKWRSIGPANMSGRITALTIFEKEPSTWWAATASGGLLKTTNNGTTFEHQFDSQSTVSIGDVQVAQSDSNILWVGTGESNPRNSVSWGDGVYKSTDSGKTWKNMGLKKIFQTGAIAIHPENPDVVFVGALGRLWGPNKDRGLYRTDDGGKTWSKVLYVNDVTGVIDVQINPKNLDEVLVATYERKRDGFDGNDPVQRFGAGSGIYKSSDGGLSFKRLSKGLPTCKLGRIGFDYYEADPNYIFAVVESEKIAKSRDDLPYGGFTGANAEVGAKITRVVAGGPSDKAGLKVDDIVLQVDGKIVMSYNGMLGEVRKKSAGDKLAVVVSRDRKMMDMEIELSNYPKTGRQPRSPFTGTLGGQAADMQEQQGEEGYQYGGVYMSDDGGESWERINSLNPRPMYYSNIQVDPTDKNNIYLCGTSLYKSSDGGKTFTGDGHDNTVHVDHHALWIDKSNSKHIILGNDGGLYVTHDRMANWDHHNHIAIGQFYHVSVDSNEDYMVYGGLQDNGSWAGPVRASDGSGPINSDWIRVGGGDGFVTLTDPNDPEQVYFESQNGGMGRIHLGTGERGFISPRPPRGQPRYRFNWKTPFMLSPHNSQIHYSAGNHVFRSFKKGDNAKPISPEIVNSDRGAGSAITESPIEAGVLYAGTTDGAVWMTRDGGQNWDALFAEPTIKKTKKDDEKKDDKSDADKSKSSESDSKESDSKKSDSKTDKKDDSAAQETSDADEDEYTISGTWNGKVDIEGVGPVEFTLEVTEKDGKLTGQTTSSAGDLEIESGSFNREKNTFEFLATSDELNLKCDGVAEGDKVFGTFELNEEMTVDFEAIRDPAEETEPKAAAEKEEKPAVNEAKPEAKKKEKKTAEKKASKKESSDAKSDDSVSGTWSGVLNSPQGEQEVTVTLVKKSDKNISGTFSSERGDREISSGFFDPETKALTLYSEDDRITIEFAGTVEDGTYEGEATINDRFTLEFELKRDADDADDDDSDDDSDEDEGDSDESDSDDDSKNSSDEAKTADKAKASDKSKTSDNAKTSDKAKATDDSSQDEEKEAGDDDPVSGTWVGEMVSPRGAQDITVKLKRESNKKISGTMVNRQGDQEIGSGSFDPESKTLSFVSETQRFTMDFSGQVEDDAFVGEVNIMDRFTMEVKLNRESKVIPKSGDDKAEDDKEEKEEVVRKSTSNLKDLLPGPRWVSSLEASKFEASHCYATFDGHRSDDDGVYVFKSEDFGKTWKSIKSNIPDTAGSARVIREDVKNKNLLFLGCEFSSWYSIDTGETWTRIKGGLPTVSVHEFAIHPTGNDVVAGTHGRSLWVADVSVLRQLNKEVMAKDSVLMKPATVLVGGRSMMRGKRLTREFVGATAERGATIAYTLGKNARYVRLTIENVRGDLVKTLEAPNRKGVHVLNWDLSSELSGGGGGGRRRGRGPSPGTYLLKLRVDDQTHTQELTVKSRD